MTDTAEPTQPMEQMIPSAPTFDSIEKEKQHRKERLASVFRVFSKFGFEEGLAGHVTARDPESVSYTHLTLPTIYSV